MVKVCQEDFPKVKGSGRQSDGFYLDGYLKDNLDLLSKNIINDMDFCIIISGNGMVRVGKSVLAQQIAYYHTYRVNELYGLKNTFTIDDIVFEGEDLVERALKLPPYSAIVYDEAGDELNTKNTWGKMMKYLTKFFRKCGQLNLYFILVIPDFFDLPKSFAVSRSHLLLNVYFSGEFERGFFQFYNYKLKNDLYFKGKKLHDYRCVFPQFSGKFTNTYTVDEKLYRAKKKKDMEYKDKDDENSPVIEKRIKSIDKIKERLGLSIEDLTTKDMRDWFSVGKTTAEDTLREYKKRYALIVSPPRITLSPKPD